MKTSRKALKLKSAQAQAFVGSSLVFSGTRFVPGDEEDHLDREGRQEGLMRASLSLYIKVLGDGLYHVPFALLFDLRNLVEYGYDLPFTSGDALGFDTDLRDRYSNTVLNRLLRERVFTKALELIHSFKQHEDGSFKERADRLVYLLVSKLAPYWPKSLIVNAAHIRSVGVDAVFDEKIQTAINAWENFVGEKEKRSHLDWSGELTLFLDSLSGVVKSDAGRMVWRDLLSEEDFFELENLEALNRDFLRYGVKNILAVRSQISTLDPSMVQLNEESSEAESNFLDDQHFQVGGISGISTKGKPSNMLSSEFVYMDEPADEGKSFDLFTMRVALNQALYYTREDGQCLRKRRKLAFILDLSKPLNVKYPDHKYQVGTMAAGFLLSFIRDIETLFEGDSVIFSLNVVGPDTEYVQEQLKVMELLLNVPVKRGLMTISHSYDLSVNTMGSKSRKTYGILFSSNPETLSTVASMSDKLKNQSEPVYPIMVDLSGKSLDLQSEDHVQIPITEVQLNPLREKILFKIMNIRQNT